MTLSREEIVAIGDELEARLVKRAALADAAAAAPTKVLPLGVEMDKYGGCTFDGHKSHAFSIWSLPFAKTEQQIGNICVQCGCDPDGTLRPAGPPPTGWETDQKWNRMHLPIQRLDGVQAHGGQVWVNVDGVNSGPNKWMYPRIRVREETLEGVLAALADSEITGPR